MTQLSLNITPCVSYASEHFVMHSGLKEALLATEPLRVSEPVVGKRFQIVFIEGAARTGKTHLSIYLSDEIAKAGRYPHLIEASKDTKLAPLLDGKPVGERDVFIMDDAEDYFSTIQPGMSGDFVSFVEALRVRGAGLVILSSLPLDKFPCDEHVRSRVVPGIGPRVLPPSESEVPLLVRALARQRGIALSDRKVEFLEKRLPRDIEQIESYLDRVQYISHVTGKPVRFPILGDAL